MIDTSEVANVVIAYLLGLASGLGVVIAVLLKRLGKLK